MRSEIIRGLLLVLVACVTLTGQTFEKAQMYVEQEHKPKLRKVAIDVEAEALVVTGKSGKYSSVVRIPYAEITGLEYEKSEHQHWKTAVPLSLLALFYEERKHWFAMIRGEEETVFQLDESNVFKILSAVESKTGKKVNFIASRPGARMEWRLFLLPVGATLVCVAGTSRLVRKRMRRTGESFSLKLILYAMDDAREEKITGQIQSLGLIQRGPTGTQANPGQGVPVDSYDIATVLYILAALAYFAYLAIPVYRYYH